MMENLRKYGNRPFRVALIHGGPGAPGEMAPVARELSAACGVLEPLQTKPTLEGQLRELRNVLQENGDPPIALVGYSWGAMLGFIFAAQNPSLIKTLILVSSAVFEDRYAIDIMRTRLSRLSGEERTMVDSLWKVLDDPSAKDKSEIFAQLDKIISRADSYDPLPHKSEVIEYQYEIYESVWKEAEELRGSGKLLELGKNIQCPVVAIHGDYDPHPAEGVEAPLSSVLKDFRFILLKNCGHRPWIERHARERFFEILGEELDCS
jgi:pimeloyl-ACP methyl ester carboxylesterase